MKHFLYSSVGRKGKVRRKTELTEEIFRSNSIKLFCRRFDNADCIKSPQLLFLFLVIRLSLNYVTKFSYRMCKNLLQNYIQIN